MCVCVCIYVHGEQLIFDKIASTASELNPSILTKSALTSSSRRNHLIFFPAESAAEISKPSTPREPLTPQLRQPRHPREGGFSLLTFNYSLSSPLKFFAWENSTFGDRSLVSSVKIQVTERRRRDSTGKRKGLAKIELRKKGSSDIGSVARPAP